MKGLVAAGMLLGMTLAAGAAGAQGAGSDAERLKAMLQCDSIKTEAVRLSCYDQAARRSRAAMGGGRVGMLPGLSAAQPRAPQQQFGMTPQLERSLPGGQADRPQPLKEITAKIASARDNGIGMWQFAFLDGSRWQMVESTKPFQPPRRGEEVRIRQASLGSYLMYVGKQPSFRVQRVR